MIRHLRRRFLIGVALVLLGATGWRTWLGVRQARFDADLVTAVNAADIARVNALLDAGADPNARPVARATSTWQGLLDALLGRRKPVGPSVLAMIAGWADPRPEPWPIVRELLRHGANPNVRDVGGASPLRWASERAPLDVVRLLLDRRADTRRPDADGYTALQCALLDSRGRGADKALLLLDRGAPTNDGGALGLAVGSPDLAVARRMLWMGTDPNARDQRGDPPLASVVWSGRLDAAALLLRKGADPTLAVPSMHPTSGCPPPWSPDIAAVQRMVQRAAEEWQGEDASPGARRAAVLRVVGDAEAEWRRKHPAAGVPRR